MHWYRSDGQPCHYQPNGKKTNLRHARKQGLIYSVTGAISLMAKMMVQEWTEEACLKAGIKAGLFAVNVDNYETLIPKAREMVEEFLDAGRKAGNEIHSVYDWINRKGKLPPAMSPIGSKWRRQQEDLIKWREENLIETIGVECSVASLGPIVGAGTIDLVGRSKTNGNLVFVDWKSQNQKAKARFYKEWVIQLAAYRAIWGICNGTDKTKDSELWSVVVNLNNPPPGVSTLTTKNWSEPDCAWGLEMYQGLSNLWQLSHKYYPGRFTALVDEASSQV